MSNKAIKAWAEVNSALLASIENADESTLGRVQGAIRILVELGELDENKLQNSLLISRIRYNESSSPILGNQNVNAKSDEHGV